MSTLSTGKNQFTELDRTLVSEMERRLGSLIGHLSRFIVEKSYTTATAGGSRRLDRDVAEGMLGSILEDASVLVGQSKAEQLHEELDTMIKGYFKEVSRDE